MRHRSKLIRKKETSQINYKKENIKKKKEASK